jgi:hypothetical protein
MMTLCKSKHAEVTFTKKWQRNTPTIHKHDKESNLQIKSKFDFFVTIHSTL